MNLTILLLVLPVALFWAWTEYWQISELLFALWVLSALVCLARGLFVFRTNKTLGAVCLGVICVQVMFLVVPRLLHMGRRRDTRDFGGDALLNEPAGGNAGLRVLCAFPRQWPGVPQPGRSASAA